MSRTPKTPPPTYSVTGDRKSILCLRCGRRSHHPQDVRHLYCAACGYHPIARDADHADPRLLVVALIARALHTAERFKIRVDAVEHLDMAMRLVEGEVVMESLSDLAGDT